MDILLISPRPDAWAECAPVFAEHGANLRTAADLPAGMDAVRQQHPALVILDLGLPADELRKAVIGILQVNAMIHTAAVSAMSEKEFHDIMEGLGMLMGLSDPPSVDGVRRLMAALSAVQG